MNEYFVDLHIHIGRTNSGSPVKITGSRDLTLQNIAQVSSMEKGIHMIGIIDCHVPEVQAEIIQLIQIGEAFECSNGGIKYQNTTIILGSEIEVMDEGYQPVHYLCYFPTLERISAFTEWLRTGMKNVNLSSQRLYKSTRELQSKVKELDGLFVPAHIFTPYKGIYGSVKCCIEEICDMNKIDAVELGLSGDRDMADQIDELSQFPFLTNSDAHSLPKIGREYQKIQMKEASFVELKMAIHNRNERKIIAYYGLSPKLGKYHISSCLHCNATIEKYTPLCPLCGGKVLKGVKHRIEELATRKPSNPPVNRPKYIHQVPLEFLPGIGKKTYDRLLQYYGTEMNILHYVPTDRLKADFGEVLADLIDRSRKGLLAQQMGGGGTYGKIISP